MGKIDQSLALRLLQSHSNARSTTLKTQHLSAYSPVVSSLGDSVRPSVQHQHHPFHPHYSDDFGKNPLRLFMKQVQDTASHINFKNKLLQTGII